MASTYADRINGVETSTAIKSPVLVATVANITLSGLQTIDGVTVVAGDRVLVRSQDNPVNNGIWNASTGAWTRSIDFNGSRDIAYGTVVYIASGSTLGNAYAIQSYSAPVIGVSQILFSTVAGSVSEAAAAASATAAEAARDDAVLYGGVQVNTFADLLPLTAAQVAVGEYVLVKKSGTWYQRQASGGHLGHTAAVLAWNVLSGADGAFLDVAFGTGDTALQVAFNTAASGVLHLTEQHIWASVVSSLQITGAGTKIIASPGAGITYSVPTLDGVRITGINVELDGWTINAPATFDGANVTPTYGVIRASGSGYKIHHCTINNVPKVGIYFDNADDCSAWENTINGNYPTGSFTGVETGHVAILINPTGTNPQGGVRIYANRIRGSVQGTLVANYGAASRTQGISIFGNTYENCWNHGVYSAQDGVGISVNGNTFVYCQVPVALTGTYHSVIGNTLTTGGSTGTYTDETGISMRNPQYCVVANNTIQGESGVGQVVINLGPVSGGTIIRGNIVTGNTVLITGAGSAEGIRIGGAGCTNLTDNIISGNSVTGLGKASLGLIEVVGNVGCNSLGTIISGNTVVVRSASYGIGILACNGVKVFGNITRLEYDSGIAVTLAGVQLGECQNCDVTGNTLIVPAAWGTNVSYRGIWELGASSTGNRASNNTMRASLVKLTSATHYVTLSGSGIIVNDTGTGAPNLNCGVGSTWTRVDGASGSVLYIKETGTGATGFVAAQGIVATNTATYDPPSLATMTAATTTVTVTGAALGDFVVASFSLDLQGIIIFAYVSAVNTVTVLFFNPTAGTIDLASGTLKARVLR